MRAGMTTTELEPVRQADAGYREKQTGEDAGCDVGCSAEPFTILEHFGRFPTKAGESCVATEKADGDGDAHVRRYEHAVERELADETEQKAAAEIDEQRAVGESASGTYLDDALQTVAGEGADRAENSDEQKFHTVTSERVG